MTVSIKDVNVDNFVVWLKANNVTHHINSKKTIIKVSLDDSMSFDSLLSAYEQNRK